ncbi:Predicted RNA-binding protein [Ferrimonas sediminum]|uniref:Predicted RNA-binding protein n=1 Tax=Ferrimonas sediminum TaxID=718193 RepID=A0A1G8RBM3_9GAMM|nr:CooT family nickel-binding protein [Ferrimonas sediminum]SDJ14387.1 Predicted RNA-binding protein [Ferrimonas sediminum]
MCNVSVVLVTPTAAETIDEVTGIEVHGETLVVNTFFASPRYLSGYRLVSADFLKGQILLEKREQSGDNHE